MHERLPVKGAGVDYVDSYVVTCNYVYEKYDLHTVVYKTYFTPLPDPLGPGSRPTPESEKVQALDPHYSLSPHPLALSCLPSTLFFFPKFLFHMFS